ncbi:MAG: aminoglycoside 6-adenylyltransferase [Flavisolibacter sp.]
MTFEKILHWINNNNNIRAVLLTGSRGADTFVDELSDYDLALFGINFQFIQNDEWLNEIGHYLICLHEQFFYEDLIIPTRLVIFNTTFKVDFSFHPLSVLSTLESKKVLPDPYNTGYKVLIDKENLTKSLPVPTFKGFIIKKPTEEEFLKNINEFWFEIHHSIKYLIRNDIWTAHSRHWAAKLQLLKMLQWENAIKSNWTFSPKNEGRNMKAWIDKNTEEELKACFWRYNRKEGHDSISATISLYEKKVNIVANSLNYKYDNEIGKQISALQMRLL